MKKIRLRLRDTQKLTERHECINNETSDTVSLDIHHQLSDNKQSEIEQEDHQDKIPSKTFEKIVLSGGGLRGCIHIGIIRYLEEKHLVNQINCWIGTSIGSLVSTLVVLGYTSTELEQIIIKFDYQRYQSMDVNHLFEHFGLDCFDKINTLITHLFAKKKIYPQITFHDLFRKTQKHLILNAVCLNTHTTTFFDYQQSPDMPVMIAIRASMSLPFIFGSVNYQGFTYVDGGVLKNFPLDHPCLRDSPQTVLGINLSNIQEYSVREIKTIDQYSFHLFTCMFNAYTKLSTEMKQQYQQLITVINITTPKYHTFDLTMSIKDKKFLINLGYRKACETFLSTKLIQITPKV